MPSIPNDNRRSILSKPAASADRAPLMVLKIDVNTFHGTREGVPNLVHLLREKEAGATFLFSLGPDHTGWAMKQVLRQGFFSKAPRTSLIAQYGIKTLLYGTLLPAPDIGRNCIEIMRAAHVAGFECGIHCWDRMVWQDQARQQSAIWTARQLHASMSRFDSIFGHSPKTHGAAGWQMNPHGLALLDQFGIGYASDGRARLDERGALQDPASGPYRIAAPDGSAHDCLQIPTTLPTLDEILGREIDGVLQTPDNVAEHLLRLTLENRRDHVYTLQAELEGQKLAPVLAALIDGWQQQGYRCVTMGEYFHTLNRAALPLLPLAWGAVPGRPGELVLA